jgi:hypothetical protein
MTGSSMRRIAPSYLPELSGEQGPSEKRFITTIPPISVAHALRLHGTMRLDFNQFVLSRDIGQAVIGHHC